MILIDQVWLDHHFVDEKYQDIYLPIPQTKIQGLLETMSDEFVAIEARKAGCMNSALAVQEIAHALYDRYPDRIRIYEHSPVSQIHVYGDKVLCMIRSTHYVDALTHDT